MCPWTSWEPATLKFCEELLCGLIRQPANTASNVGFVICGLMIWRREGKGWSPFHLMGLASILIGVTSGMFHASLTFFWQFFDVSSMFMLILLPATFNLIRLSWVRLRHFTWVYLALLFFSQIIMLVVKGNSGEWLFGVEVFLVVLMEWRLRCCGGVAVYRSMLKALGVFLLAFVIWNGDIHGWWCDPQNHWLQGHALWHLLCALAIWFVYLFYKQFLEIKGGGTSQSV